MYFCPCSCNHFLHKYYDHNKFRALPGNYSDIDQANVITYSVSSGRLFKQKTKFTFQVVIHEHTAYLNIETVNLCWKIKITEDPQRERRYLKYVLFSAWIFTVPRTYIEFIRLKTFVEAITNVLSFQFDSCSEFILVWSYLLTAITIIIIPYTANNDKSPDKSPDLKPELHTFRKKNSLQSDKLIRRDLVFFKVLFAVKSNVCLSRTYSLRISRDDNIYVQRQRYGEINKMSGGEKNIDTDNVGTNQKANSQEQTVQSSEDASTTLNSHIVQSSEDDSKTLNSQSVQSSQDDSKTLNSQTVQSSQDDSKTLNSQVKSDTANATGKNVTNSGASTSYIPLLGGSPKIPKRLEKLRFSPPTFDSKHSKKNDDTKQKNSKSKAGVNTFFKQFEFSQRNNQFSSVDNVVDAANDNKSKNIIKYEKISPSSDTPIKETTSSVDDYVREYAVNNNEKLNILKQFNTNSGTQSPTGVSNNAGFTVTINETTDLDDSRYIDTRSEDYGSEDEGLLRVNKCSTDSSISDNISMIVDSTFLTPADKKLEEVRSPEDGVPIQTEMTQWDQETLERTLQESIRLAIVDLGRVSPELLQQDQGTPPESDSTGSATLEDPDYWDKPLQMGSKGSAKLTSIDLRLADAYHDAAEAYVYHSPTGSNIGSVPFISAKSLSNLDNYAIQKTSSMRIAPKTSDSKKGVRFADVEGLNLENVRHFYNSSSPPYIPPSVFQNLVKNIEKHTYDYSIKYLVPCFDQPGATQDFLQKVNSQKVCLENVITTDMTIRGYVRVSNVSYHKSVGVRYTLDAWSSFSDVEARYIDNSCNGPTDRFSFVIVASACLEPGSNMELAVFLKTNGIHYWDNNKGRNYIFKCYDKSTSSRNNLQK